jgi:hypothetical protein
MHLIDFEDKTCQFSCVTQAITSNDTCDISGMKLIEANMEIVWLPGVELLHFI